MPMLADPSLKYATVPAFDLPNRRWPTKALLKAPRWLSTDLRDGNQALVNPMDGDQKWKYFQMLVGLGYKEIEVSYPSASQTDFEFTRRLIETPNSLPEDVCLQVLSPCREDLIQRTVDSLRGANKAVLHLYLATSDCFRRVVFGFTQEESIALAVKCTRFARSITKDSPDAAVRATQWSYEFTPENFSDTSPDFVIRFCEAVKKAWEPSESNPIIFNLPATVERTMPNIYADQVEFFCRNMTERDKICVSVHPHNDRGCAVAAAEMAQLAGADRVEGCLFGHGERTGNVDLVTLALNLYTQGISPNIDFSNISNVVGMVETCSDIPVHPRTPYAGSLVVCAFSGSHQDAIRKGFQDRDEEQKTDPKPLWKLPYLPFDPRDIGRDYESIIRVNSQSGKGGVAWVIQQTLELDIPRGLQIVFSRLVQERADALSRELLAPEIQDLFESRFGLKPDTRIALSEFYITNERRASDAANPTQVASTSKQPSQELKRYFQGTILVDGHPSFIKGTGNGAISSLANALQNIGVYVEVVDYKEHAIGRGTNVRAATYIECLDTKLSKRFWGAGINADVVQASLAALISAASSSILVERARVV
ncbi:hypothetical protein V499_01094 [Pseudogymnoascus sp. VKM F-103]|nr:hypothetical protein V499_01094 [Pseudogymnoascus sp. VKM F-103]